MSGEQNQEEKKKKESPLSDSCGANSLMSANFESELERVSSLLTAEVRQEGCVRLMGPWPHAASWPQSLPVFAGPEFGHSGALRTSASSPHVSVVVSLFLQMNR